MDRKISIYVFVLEVRKREKVCFRVSICVIGQKRITVCNKEAGMKYISTCVSLDFRGKRSWNVIRLQI